MRKIRTENYKEDQKKGENVKHNMLNIKFKESNLWTKKRWNNAYVEEYFEELRYTNIPNQKKGANDVQEKI